MSFVTKVTKMVTYVTHLVTHRRGSPALPVYNIIVRHEYNISMVLLRVGEIVGANATGPTSRSQFFDIQDLARLVDSRRVLLNI